MIMSNESGRMLIMTARASPLTKYMSAAFVAGMWITKRSWAGRSHRMDAEEILVYLAELLLLYLEELNDARGRGENSFRYGEQTAYTE